MSNGNREEDGKENKKIQNTNREEKVAAAGRAAAEKRHEHLYIKTLVISSRQEPDRICNRAGEDKRGHTKSRSFLRVKNGPRRRIRGRGRRRLYRCIYDEAW